MNTFALALLGIALSTAAQFSLKAGMSTTAVKAILAHPFTLRTGLTIFTDKYILGGLALYGLGAVVWLGVLSRWDVSKAYPLVGLGFVFTIAIGLMIGEQVTLPRILGVLLICSGVVLIGRT